MRDNLDQAFRLELARRIVNQGAGDPDHLAQIALAHPGAGLETPTAMALRMFRVTV